MKNVFLLLFILLIISNIGLWVEIKNIKETLYFRQKAIEILAKDIDKIRRRES